MSQNNIENEQTDKFKVDQSEDSRGKLRYVEYGEPFRREGQFRTIAEILLFLIILFISINLFLDWILDFFFPEIDTETRTTIFTAIRYSIVILAALSAVSEWIAIYFSKIGDIGRRASFYMDFISDDMRKEVENRLEEKYAINREEFKKSYFNEKRGLEEDVDLFPRKVFRFYSKMFKFREARRLYKKYLSRRYFLAWVILIPLIALSILTVSDFGIQMLFAVTGIVLIPYIKDTYGVIQGWEKKNEKLDYFMNRALNLDRNHEHDLDYLFLEYTIELQKVFKLPDRFYSKHKEYINNLLNKSLKLNENKLIKLGIKLKH